MHGPGRMWLKIEESVLLYTNLNAIVAEVCVSYGTVDYDATIQKNEVYFCILTGGLQDTTGTNQDGQQYWQRNSLYVKILGVCGSVFAYAYVGGEGRASTFVLLYFPELQGKYPVGAYINL